MASPNLALPSICHRPKYVTGRKGGPSHDLKNGITWLPCHSPSHTKRHLPSYGTCTVQFSVWNDTLPNPIWRRGYFLHLQTSQFEPATSQVFNSHIGLVATILHRSAVAEGLWEFHTEPSNPARKLWNVKCKWERSTREKRIKKASGYNCFKEVILEEDNGKLWHFGDIFLIGGKSSWKNTHTYIYVYSLLIYLVELFFIWS